MIPTKPLPNWCIDNICFPIGTLVDPSSEYSCLLLLLPPQTAVLTRTEISKAEFYETRQHHRPWTDEGGGEVYIQSGSFVGGPAFFNINTVCVSITNENERPSKHTCHRYLKVKESDRYNSREFHSFSFAERQISFGNDSNFGFDGCFCSRGKLAFDTKDSFRRPDNKRKMSKMWGDGDVSESNKSFLKEKKRPQY